MNKQIADMLKNGKTIKCLSAEELIELFSATDMTSQFFNIIQSEVIRRITGGSYNG